MIRLVRGRPTPWPPEGTGEPETNVSVPQKGRQIDAKEGKSAADYDPDVDYESEGSNPDIEAVNEKEENSDAEHAKLELRQARTLCQSTMNCKVAKRNQAVTLATRTRNYCLMAPGYVPAAQI